MLPTTVTAPVLTPVKKCLEARAIARSSNTTLAARRPSLAVSSLDAHGRGNYSLEPDLRSEPEPPITLRPDAHAECVARDFFPAVGLMSALITAPNSSPATAPVAATGPLPIQGPSAQLRPESSPRANPTAGTSAVGNPGAGRWLVAVPGDGSSESSFKNGGNGDFTFQIDERKLQI